MRRLIARCVDVRAGEIAALLWSFAYFFFLLGGYYVLRPLRDAMGLEGGVRNLQWLFTATFVAMAVAVPLFGAVVAKAERRRIVPIAYRFFLANILIFYALLTLEIRTVHVARVFFVWVSVYNLFVVSVFWSVMADAFDNGQGKRLFGFIAAGGTAGSLLGPAATALLAVPLGAVNLLLVAALCLEIAAQCAKRVLRGTRPDARDRARDERIGGSVLAGITDVARSPYLLAICVYILFLTLTATVLYFQQAAIVADAFASAAERTRAFATIDLAVGVMTLLLQATATGPFIRRFGVGWALALLPLVTAAGFLVLGLWPTLAVVVAFQAIRRAANFAISKPAREILFTLVPREDKYKAKNLIDTLVYRGGDAAAGWAYAAVAATGIALSGIAFLALPAAFVWLALAFAMGRGHDRRAGGLSAAPANDIIPPGPRTGESP